MKQTAPILPIKQEAIPYLFVIISLCLMSLFFDKGDDVRLINGHHAPLLDVFYKTITNLGDGLIFIPVLIACLFIRFRFAILSIALCIVHGLLVSIFKRLLFADVARPRKYLGDDAIHFVDGISVHSLHSFPSGHTATAFCVALFIALLSRNKTIGLLTLLLALLVGYSRVYLAQHFLPDVAAGALIGCFTTYVLWQVFENSQLPQWMNRKLQLPKPRKQTGAAA